MIRDAKKTYIIGDIFPSLVNQCAPFISVPLCNIYNQILVSYVWPIAWKRERVTVIPKKNMPESLSDLRNISCTLLISKIFEGFVLKCILEEITIKDNQYGGTKGCSTTHMIISIMQEICDNAEDYRSATVLAAIDYAKAFNRLSFQHCLEAFRAKGASTPILRLLATFLTNRTMMVRVGETWSEPLDVTGGCPQGSLLGIILFNATTDNLEQDSERREERRLGVVQNYPPESPSRPVQGCALPPEASSPTTSVPIPEWQLSPISAGSFSVEQGGKFKPAVIDREVPAPTLVQIPTENPVGTQVWIPKHVLFFKYVDDNLSCEKMNLGSTIITLRDGKPIKMKQAIPLQNSFRCITANARKKGMVVNTLKTNLLCVSDALQYKAVAFIVDEEGNRIESTDEMRVLGFYFGCKPTVDNHVQHVTSSLRRKFWALRHLDKLGMSEENLVKVYKCSILPIADYCAPAYHSMLTDAQDQSLEQAQVGALRCIFGYGISGRKMRQKSKVQTLRERRVMLTDRFARKCITSRRFRHWFPLEKGRRSGRSGEIYKEFFAKCERLKNSPLYYMRRRLNGKEGKIYGSRNREYRE